MTLPALAQAAPSLTQASCCSDAGVLENRNDTNGQTDKKCEAKKKQKYRHINVNPMQARQPGRRGCDQHAKSRRGNPQSNCASGASQHQAFKKQAADNFLASGSEGSANCKFLPPSFNAN